MVLVLVIVIVIVIVLPFSFAGYPQPEIKGFKRLKARPCTRPAKGRKVSRNCSNPYRGTGFLYTSHLVKVTFPTLLLLLAVVIRATADRPIELTKTSQKEFDIPKEVVAFVSNLIETNPEVRRQYERLTAATRENAGGRFSVGTFVPIEWLVPNYESNTKDTGSSSDGEYIYLVQQQLIFGFHRGYSVEDNVVARVHVRWHEVDPPVQNSLKMTFEGFVTVALNPAMAPSSVSETPAFDNSAVNAEKNGNIEDDPRFAPLDARLNKVYSALRAKLSPGKRDQLKQLERDFLERRDQVKDKPDSFFALTEQQIAILQQMLNAIR
jgi:uncharacterized protein YecT (DUF1311 family)